MSVDAIKEKIQQAHAETQRIKQMISMLQENIDQARNQYHTVIGQISGMNHALQIMEAGDGETVDEIPE